MLPASRLRYSDYALEALQAEGDTAIALLAAQEQALQDAQHARTIAQNTTIVVEESPFAADGAVIQVGISSTSIPLPNQGEWERVAAEFASQNADIGAVIVEASMTPTIDNMSQSYDCFVLTYNPTPTIDMSLITPVDPLMRQDPAFMPQDFLPTILDDVRQNGMILAYPLTIQARFLQMDRVQMGNVGVVVDNDQWSVDQFTDAVTQWQRSTNSAAYNVTRSLDLMALIASYGGLPIDTRTNPPDIAFTEPANFAATQQVLDMVQDGRLGYEPLTVPAGMGSASNTPIQMAVFGPIFGSPLGGEANLLHYPVGLEYAPISYSLVTGLISADTPYADACYRFLDTISQQSSLFVSMPVRHSVLESAEAQSTLGGERIALYRRFSEVMQGPQTVVIPSVNAIGSSDLFVLQYLFNRAADAYVLQGVNLADALSQSQSDAEAYLQCRSADTSVHDCAQSIEPEIASVLGPAPDDD